MKKRIQNAAPARYDETPSYRRFSTTFAPLALTAVLILVYTLTIFIDSPLSVSSKILEMLPILEGRIEFLEKVGGYSEIGYVAAVMVGLIMVPLLVAINAFFYWRLVLVPRKNMSVNLITLAIIANGFIVFGVLVWIVFVSVPHLYDPSKAGLRVVLFWPIFPALASGVIYLVAEMAFRALIGLLKFILPHGDSSG